MGAETIAHGSLFLNTLGSGLTKDLFPFPGAGRQTAEGKQSPVVCVAVNALLSGRDRGLCPVCHPHPASPGQQPLALQGRWLYGIVTLPTEDKETQAARGEPLTFPNGLLLLAGDAREM